MQRVTWTRDEMDLIELVGLSIEVEVFGLPETAIGIGGSASKKSAPERLSANLRASWLEHGRERSDLPFNLKMMFESFAHQNDIDTNHEFWIIKAVAAASLQHPYFAAGVQEAIQGRPPSEEPTIEADLHEWWIQANRLRAIMEAALGEKVSDRGLAEEMARRKVGSSALEDDTRVGDQFVSSANYFLRLLKYDKQTPYLEMLIRYDFNLPSMRINTSLSTHSPQSATKLIWAPSETELTETRGWLAPYQKIRKDQLEKARSIVQR
ncbi:hypothetical protein [Devosia psychrophila]|uniref:Uncharacterized protein n=1 Tax=Devosia psychrophila TaxID=728005 RepID=A0A0F5PW41_9HYPH|nr:hypothetical protein [Devosia psychrophila]KKC32601.1 hypothetical protein WH91_12245 [Devosia psychrophila]SFC49439.1 hypothetical protein SAMN04488059_1065 [Devosia psychrophila]